VFPMDKVKTRLQSHGGTIISTATQIIAKEGTLKMMFRGLSPQLVMIGPVNAAQMTTNDFVQRKFRGKSERDLKLWELSAAALSASVAEIAIGNPQEVVKIRMQMQGIHAPVVSALQIVKEIGITGLYKGVGACMLRDLPFNLIFFLTYDYLKRVFADKTTKNIDSTRLLMAGTTAAAIASAACTPADVIKTKLQNGTQQFKSYGECIRQIIAEGGYSAFFRGLTSRLLIIAPMFGIQFMLFEKMQKYFYG